MFRYGMIALQFPFETDEGFIQSFLFFPTLTVGIPESASKLVFGELKFDVPKLL